MCHVGGVVGVSGAKKRDILYFDSRTRLCIIAHSLTWTWNVCKWRRCHSNVLRIQHGKAEYLVGYLGAFPFHLPWGWGKPVRPRLTQHSTRFKSILQYYPGSVFHPTCLCTNKTKTKGELKYFEIIVRTYHILSMIDLYRQEHQPGTLKGNSKPEKEFKLTVSLDVNGQHPKSQTLSNCQN